MSLLGGSLRQDHQLTVNAPPASVARQLSEVVHEHPGPFVLTFKLSGGGIVSRVMETPETEAGWFGEVDSRRLRLVSMPDGGDVTPFQPIVRAQLTAVDEGTRVDVVLEPHPGQHSWSLPFAVVGGVLSIWGAVVFVGGEAYLGCLAMAFGAAFNIFPRWRARRGFDGACLRDLARLRRDLGLES